MILSFILFFIVFFTGFFIYSKRFNIRVNISLVIVIMFFFIILLNYNVYFFNWPNYKIYFLILLLFSYIPIIIINDKISFDKEFLMLMVLLGSLTLVVSENLIIVYLALELQTFSLFILISGNRNSIKSNEGGLKYFILGAISSGLYLISLSIVYYISGGLSIDHLNSLSNEGFNYI